MNKRRCVLAQSAIAAVLESIATIGALAWARPQAFRWRTGAYAALGWIMLASLSEPPAHAASSAAPSAAVPCPRFSPGSEVRQARDLYSVNGVLEVDLAYRTQVDVAIPVDQSPTPSSILGTGLQQFCFVTPNGDEQPTLHVKPGDHLIIHVKNEVPKNLAFEADGTIDYNQPPGTDNLSMDGMAIETPCLAVVADATSTNIHFHGLNAAPICGQDDTLHTLINAGQSFTYDVHIPSDEPAGLYWYHPHVHGMNEGVVQGGASGAIVVEGLQDYLPSLAGLREQILVIRDQPVPGNPTPVIGSEIPSWDLTLNYVTISSCQSASPCAPNQFVGDFKAALMKLKPGEKQLWRVVNAASHTALDLQLQYDGLAQPLEIVALDGVAVNSRDGSAPARGFAQSHIPMAPASRAEFVVTGPPRSVRNATLRTLRVPTGPDGDNHPERPLANIDSHGPELHAMSVVPQRSKRTLGPARFSSLASLTASAHRKLYFSEVLSDPSVPTSPTNFFITVDGQQPKVFDPNDPPSIVTNQGAVEDWTIENRSQENHAFHIHQVHFLTLARDGVEVTADERQYLDTITLPYWKGTGPYPSVTLRMDFRGAVVGDVMYHCHFIFHSDFGMMAVLRVLPATNDKR